MKKILFVAAAVLCIAACAPKEEQKVMARHVPERMDDFIWENDCVCYRAYGQALEGNPTAPGFDVWVKTPGKLVANERYRLELEENQSYHIDHGNGKDCYKVAVSLGAGASSPVVDGQFVFPATNWRSYEILKDEPSEVVFVLHYPAWEVAGAQVTLDKKITVTPGTNFCKAEDVYSGDFDSLTIAAGLIRHDIEAEISGDNYVAIWEHASDQSMESEEGMIGLAVYMPDAESVEANGPAEHAVLYKTVKSGEPVVYYFGSGWSRGNMPDSEQWFETVKEMAE